MSLDLHFKILIKGIAFILYKLDFTHLNEFKHLTCIYMSVQQAQTSVQGIPRI